MPVEKNKIFIKSLPTIKSIFKVVGHSFKKGLQLIEFLNKLIKLFLVDAVQ